MSPLKITLLLNCYSRSLPTADLPEPQAFAPAMLSAIEDLCAQGVLREGTTAAALRGHSRAPAGGFLTLKGESLVHRLREVEA